MMTPKISSARVQRLLRRFPPTGKEKTWYPNGADERAVLLWQHFQAMEDEPLSIRFAHGLAYVMQHIAITIHDDELIVGEVGLEDMAVNCPDDLPQAIAFWQQRNLDFNQCFSWHAAEQLAADHALSWKWASRDGHTIPAFELVLAQGLATLRTATCQAAEQVDLVEELNPERQCFWQAMIIALQALSDYIYRYSVLARQMAHSENRLSRQKELSQIADSCEWLAGNPPRSFAEALQLVWFIHLGIKPDDGGIGHSFGRFDQYLYPYYQADINNGLLDDDGARQLLALFWIKLNREGDDIAHLSLGGQTPAGADATNALSHLCLQVERWISRKQPNLSTRVHDNTSGAYWREIAETILAGAGHPAVFNDAVIVAGLLDYGFPSQATLDYAQVGCVETFFPGLAAPWTDCYLNLAKCLELALNNGHDLLSGVQIGPATGDPYHMNGFTDLVSAYEYQVETALRQMLAAKDEFDTRVSQHAPEPLNSAFIHDCLQRGLDATGGGGRYLLTGVYGIGLGTTVDSLAAIRTMVYEQGLANVGEFLDALRANFVGYDRLRSFCKQRAPKYGNDDDQADSIAVSIIESFGRQVKKYSDDVWHACQALNHQADRRIYHYAMFGSVLSHTGMGAGTAASANGRLAGETLSDGGSPSQGCNRLGATATLRSLSKADYRLAPGGAAINLRLSPGYFPGETGPDILASLLKTYVALGGEQIQVNMVSTETMRRAMQTPDDYRDLVVRVAGFTAYFVSLTPELQHELLSRAEG